MRGGKLDVCVCVCVCEREKGREGEKGEKRKNERFLVGFEFKNDELQNFLRPSKKRMKTMDEK